MSVTTAILRKDLRQFRFVIGLLAGLLAVLLAVRLEWTGGVMPDPAANVFVRTGLEGMLVIVTVILAGKLVAGVVFADSPGRRGRFLATRPVSVVRVLFAKLLLLTAFVAGPFALAAALHLALSGMPGRVVFLGTAQSLVRSGVLIAFAVPLVVLWETRRRFIVGLVAAGAGVGAFALAIGLLHKRGGPFRPDIFADPLVQVKAVAIGAVVLGAVLAVHLRRLLGLATRLAIVFLAGIIVPLLAGISTSRQPAVAAEDVPRCEMVRLGFNPNYTGDQPVLGIGVTPSIPTPPGEDTVWSLASLRFGEHSVPLRSQRDPRLAPSHYLHSQISRGIEAALRRHLGAGWAMVSETAWRDLSPATATAFARPPRIPAGPAPVETLLRGHRFSWQCVAELPFTPGSSVRDGDATWTFGRIAADQLRRFAFSLSHRGPELWLDPRGRSGTFKDRRYAFAVLDPERRLIAVLRDPFPAQTTLGTGTACPRRGLVVRLDSGDVTDDFAAGDPARLRLLVLRSRYEGTQFARWSSPSPVALPKPRRGSPHRGLANDAHDLQPDDIARWISENPAPPASGPDAAIVPYLVALLEQTNRCGRLSEEHPAVASLAAYVPGHLDLLLRALDALQMDQHSSEQLLYYAIHSGLERRQVPEVMRGLSEHPLLFGLIVERGWAADLAPDLTRLVRNGCHHDVILRQLPKLPEFPGVSRDEWLALFRLQPNCKTYRTLSRVAGLEEELNTIIDSHLAGHVPVLSDHAPDPLLQLALTRGHADGPVLLHRTIRYSIGLNPHNAHWLSDDITRHFALTSYTGQHHDDEAVVAWFLDQDPAGFSYDPASRKYRLEPAAP